MKFASSTLAILAVLVFTVTTVSSMPVAKPSGEVENVQVGKRAYNCFNACGGGKHFNKWALDRCQAECNDYLKHCSSTATDSQDEAQCQKACTRSGRFVCGEPVWRYNCFTACHGSNQCQTECNDYLKHCSSTAADWRDEVQCQKACTKSGRFVCGQSVENVQLGKGMPQGRRRRAQEGRRRRAYKGKGMPEGRRRHAYPAPAPERRTYPAPAPEPRKGEGMPEGRRRRAYPAPAPERRIYPAPAPERRTYPAPAPERRTYPAPAPRPRMPEARRRRAQEGRRRRAYGFDPGDYRTPKGEGMPEGRRRRAYKGKGMP